MPRMMIIDTYYPEVIQDIEYIVTGSATYNLALERVMNVLFGTSDFYSRHLRAFGWEVRDVIANFRSLQLMWARESRVFLDPDVPARSVLEHQIDAFQPDVIFLQSLSILGPLLKDLKSRYLIAGQCSCAIRRELIPDFRVIFTSFPHYVRKYNREQSACKFVYNPLAFEPAILEYTKILSKDRHRDITFIGGVGRPSHWTYGMQILERVAVEFPDKFTWYGYGFDTLNGDSPLIPHYRGHAWGHDMYRLYTESKIVINRHGEISDRYANNMRMYEATGCGALLMTEQKANLHELFTDHEVVAYQSPDHLIEQIHYYLDHPSQRERIAWRGQNRTTTDHTYRERMRTVSDTLMELL